MAMGTDRHAALAGHAVPRTGQTATAPEILAEAAAEPEGSIVPPGVPSDFCDQLGKPAPSCPGLPAAPTRSPWTTTTAVG
jgi:hypothetical protein